MSGRSELVKAGKIPLTVIAGLGEDFPVYGSTALDDWQRKQARRGCARHRLNRYRRGRDGNWRNSPAGYDRSHVEPLTRQELATVLAMLGLA